MKTHEFFNNWEEGIEILSEENIRKIITTQIKRLLVKPKDVLSPEAEQFTSMLNEEWKKFEIEIEC